MSSGTQSSPVTSSSRLLSSAVTSSSSRVTSSLRSLVGAPAPYLSTSCEARSDIAEKILSNVLCGDSASASERGVMGGLTGGGVRGTENENYLGGSGDFTRTNSLVFRRKRRLNGNQET